MQRIDGLALEKKIRVSIKPPYALFFQDFSVVQYFFVLKLKKQLKFFFIFLKTRVINMFLNKEKIF